jgi:hypothetical protein
VPDIELPTVELPTVELPTVELPAVELPTVELPTVELPAVELPAVELPAVRLPAVELPAMYMPNLPTVRVSMPGMRDLAEGLDTPEIIEKIGKEAAKQLGPLVSAYFAGGAVAFSLKFAIDQSVAMYWNISGRSDAKDEMVGALFARLRDVRAGALDIDWLNELRRRFRLPPGLTAGGRQVPFYLPPEGQTLFGGQSVDPYWYTEEGQRLRTTAIRGLTHGGAVQQGDQTAGAINALAGGIGWFLRIRGTTTVRTPTPGQPGYRPPKTPTPPPATSAAVWERVTGGRPVPVPKLEMPTGQYVAAVILAYPWEEPAYLPLSTGSATVSFDGEDVRRANHILQTAGREGQRFHGKHNMPDWTKTPELRELADLFRRDYEQEQQPPQPAPEPEQQPPQPAPEPEQQARGGRKIRR